MELGPMCHPGCRVSLMEIRLIMPRLYAESILSPIAASRGYLSAHCRSLLLLLTNLSHHIIHGDL